jgi:hypothetical protein
MKPSAGLTFSVLGAVLAVAVPALAFQYPLSSTEIRDAYFIGKQYDLRAAEFFAQYKHVLPAPETGSYVAAISISTPFVQVAERSGSTADYDSLDAQKEFESKRLPFRVRVEIDVTPTYSGLVPSDARDIFSPAEDSWQDFEVELIQGKKIPAKSVRGALFYTDGAPNVYGIGGAIIQLLYDAEKIDTHADVTIQVHTPDGQDVETTFDLGRLR